MKIEFRNLYIPFDEVEEGQCFYCDNDGEDKDLFMKTCTYHIPPSATFNHDVYYNCINLKTGYLDYLTLNEKVTVCNAKVVVEG